jgi:hypothetical protein
VEVGDGEIHDGSNIVCPLWVTPARFVAVSAIDHEVFEFRTSKFLAICQGDQFDAMRSTVIYPALQLEIQHHHSGAVEVHYDGWKGGAEHDVDAELANAMDLGNDEVHDSNDLRTFMPTVYGIDIVEGSPGYDDIE